MSVDKAALFDHRYNITVQQKGWRDAEIQILERGFFYPLAFKILHVAKEFDELVRDGEAVIDELIEKEIVSPDAKEHLMDCLRRVIESVIVSFD